MGVKITIVINQNSQNIANNTSNVTVRVNAVWDSGSYNHLQKSGWLKIDGTTYNFTSSFNTGNTTSGVGKLFEKTVDVKHGSDGKKTLSCSASYTSGVSSGTVGASASKVLTTIPRKSTLSASNGTLGTALALTVTKQASSFTHTITYKCGTASGTICTKSSDTSVSWTPPKNLANQNTTGTSVSVTFTITTYNGSTSVGSNTKTISCSIPSTAEFKPSCTIELNEITTYGEQYGKPLRGLSTFLIDINPQEAYGSEIKSFNATADGTVYRKSSFNTDVVKSASAMTVEATVTDARGRTSPKVTASMEVYDYVPPKISKLTVHRCDGDGTPNDRGECIKAVFSYDVDGIGSKNKVLLRLKYKKSSDPESAYTEANYYVSPKNYTGIDEEIIIYNADTGSSYDIKLEISDNFNSTSKLTSASTAFTLMHWRADGTGMAIGKISEEQYLFDIGIKTRFEGGLLPPIIDSNTDLNDIKTANVYIGQNANAANYLNCPLTSGTFVFIVEAAGPDGQVHQKLIRCYKEDPTQWERFYYSNAWGEWQKCQPAIDTGWQTLALGSEFAVYSADGSSPAQCRRIGKMVEVRGIVKNTVEILGSTDMHTITTLPSGYIPSQPIYKICQGSGNCTWLLRVSTNGKVDLSRYRNGEITATMSPLGVWLPFQVTFFVD
jgi:hypothetical protein